MARTDAAVVVVFKSRDQLSKALDRISRKSDTTANRVKKSLAKINAAAKKTGSIMGGMLGSMAIAQGLYMITMGVRKVTEEFVGMDQALTSAGAKFPEMIGRGTKAMEKLEAAARKIGGTTEFTSKAAAEGLEFLAMTGFNAEQAISVLPSVVDLATGANMDLARATDIASDALGAFNMKSKDTAVLTTNLDRINDVFAKTVTTANVTLEDMFETMKYAAPVMTTAGQSIETFSALTGVMGNAGIKASIAGTTLKNMMLKLAAPGTKAKKVLKSLGVTLADSNGDMRDLFDVLQDLETGTADLGTQQKSMVLDTIMGKRAIAGANVVMMEGISTARKYRTELENAGGSSKKMADMMRKGLGKRLDVLKSSMIELGFKVFETFQEKFPNALDDTIAAIQNFDPKPMIETLRDLIDGGKKAYQIFLDWRPAIVAAVGAFAALKTVLAAATVAQWVFNFAVAMNPFTMLVMAIGSAIALLWYYWDDVQKFAESIVEAIMWAGDMIGTGMANVAYGIYNGFVTVWEGIIDLFVWGAKKVINLAGSLGGVFGMDIDIGAATEKLESFADKGRINKKAYTNYDEVRKARQGFMGLPQTSLGEETLMREDSVGPTGMSGLDRSRANKVALDPAALKGALDQNTDVNISLDFKNLAADFGQQISVDSNSQSSNGRTTTTVNRSLVGAN